MYEPYGVDRFRRLKCSKQTYKIRVHVNVVQIFCSHRVPRLIKYRRDVRLDVVYNLTRHNHYCSCTYAGHLYRPRWRTVSGFNSIHPTNTKRNRFKMLRLSRNIRTNNSYPLAIRQCCVRYRCVFDNMYNIVQYV